MVFRHHVPTTSMSFGPNEVIIVDDSESEVEELPGPSLFEDFPRHVKCTKRKRPTKMDIGLPSPASKHRRLQTRSGRAVVPLSQVHSFAPLSSASPNPKKGEVLDNEVITVQSDEENGGKEGKKKDRGSYPVVLCKACATKRPASSSSRAPRARSSEECSCSHQHHHPHATSTTSSHRHSHENHHCDPPKHMKSSTTKTKGSDPPMKKSSSSPVVAGDCSMCRMSAYNTSASSSSSMVPCSSCTHHPHATSTSRQPSHHHHCDPPKHMKGSDPPMKKKNSSSPVVAGDCSNKGGSVVSSPASKRARYGACIASFGGTLAESSPRYRRRSQKALSTKFRDHGIPRPHEERTDFFSKLPEAIVEQIAEFFNQGSRFKMCIVHRSFHFLQEEKWNEVIDLRPVGISSKVTFSGRRVVQRHNVNSRLSDIRRFLTIRPRRFRESTVLVVNAQQFPAIYENLMPIIEELCPNVRILRLLNIPFDGMELSTTRQGLKQTNPLIERALRGRQIEIAIIEDANDCILPRKPCIIKVEPLSLDICTAFTSKTNPCMQKRISAKLFCDRHLKCRQVLHYSFSRQRAIQAEYNQK